MTETPRVLDERAFEQQKASWLELFFDLAYVAAIAQLTYWLIESSGGLIDYMRFLILFLIVYQSWLFMSFYRNAAGEREDRFERVATLVQMFFVLVMSIFIHNAFDIGATGFVIGYVGTRLVGATLFSRFYTQFPDQAPRSTHLMQGIRVGNFLWLATIFAPQPFQTLFWVLMIAYDLILPHATSRRVTNTVRIANRFHLPERLGLLTILVMGESVIVVAVVNNIADAIFTWATGGIAAAAFLIMAGLWWMYFDHVEYFAIGKKFQLFPYVYTHIPILLGIMFLAAGTKAGMLDKVHGLDPFWLTTFGVALAIIGFNGLKIATGQQIARRFMPSAIFIAFTAIGAFISNLPFLVAIIILTFVFFGYMYFEHKVNHAELHALRLAQN